MVDYQAGVPNWVDVSSQDFDKTYSFYTQLFGWGGDRGGPEMGGYTIFTLDGKMVAGGGPAQSPDQPAAWSTYMQSDDSEATVEAVKSAGGQVVFGPQDVMDQGRLCVFQDPTGAFFSTWQPGEHKGAEHVNEVGGFCWSELYTRDVPNSVKFYKQVFGYDTEEIDMDNGGKYMLFKVGERPIGGALDMNALNMPSEIPPHWLAYFTVADNEAAMKKAQELGGEILSGPIETPQGPMAVVRDSAGAVFATIQLKT